MATTTFLEPGTDATEDLIFYGTVTGTVASASDQAKTGLRSIKVSSGSPAATAQLSSPVGVFTDSGSQMSFYFRISALPAADAVILQIQQAAGGGIANIFLQTDGKLRFAPVGATAATGTTVLAANTWYRICISFYITNTTTFAFKTYVDGVLDSTANAGTLTRTTSSIFKFALQSTVGANVDVWFDDIYCATGGASSSSQPDTGNILVTAKRPNANGTTNGMTGTGAGSGYGTGNSVYVNERPLSLTSYVSVLGVGATVTEEYNIENLSTGDVDLTGAILVDYVGWVFAKVAVGTEAGQLILNGSNSAKTYTTTDTLFTTFAGSTTYPAGTGSDIGVITDTSLTTFTLEECGIIFAFTVGVGTLSTLPLLGAG